MAMKREEKFVLCLVLAGLIAFGAWWGFAQRSARDYAEAVQRAQATYRVGDSVTLDNDNPQWSQVVRFAKEIWGEDYGGLAAWSGELDVTVDSVEGFATLGDALRAFPDLHRVYEPSLSASEQPQYGYLAVTVTAANVDATPVPNYEDANAFNAGTVVRPQGYGELVAASFDDFPGSAHSSGDLRLEPGQSRQVILLYEVRRDVKDLVVGAGDGGPELCLVPISPHWEGSQR